MKWAGVRLGIWWFKNLPFVITWILILNQCPQHPLGIIWNPSSSILDLLFLSSFWGCCPFLYSFFPLEALHEIFPQKKCHAKLRTSPAWYMFWNFSHLRMVLLCRKGCCYDVIWLGHILDIISLCPSNSCSRYMTVLLCCWFKRDSSIQLGTCNLWSGPV